jgi:hypothetical protein
VTAVEATESLWSRPQDLAGVYRLPLVANHLDPPTDPADAQDGEDLGLEVVDRSSCARAAAGGAAGAATGHRRPAAHPVLAEFGRLARRWPTIRAWSSPSTWRTPAHHAHAECVRLATLAWVTRSRARPWSRCPGIRALTPGERLDRAPGRTAGRWRLDDLRLPHLPRARPLVVVSQPGQLAAVANAAEHELPAQDCRKPARRRVLNVPVAIQTIPALLRRRRPLVTASVERFRSSGEHTGLSPGRAHGITSRIAHRGSSAAHQ